MRAGASVNRGPNLLVCAKSVLFCVYPLIQFDAFDLVRECCALPVFFSLPALFCAAGCARTSLIVQKRGLAMQCRPSRPDTLTSALKVLHSCRAPAPHCR